MFEKSDSKFITEEATSSGYKRGSLLRHKELHDETIYKGYNCVSQFTNKCI